MSKNINTTGKYMNGDIWLSRESIKNILFRDVIDIPDITPEVKNYILGLVKRFENMSIR